MDEGTYGARTAQVNWASAADFWAMGGYGFYVWGSYGSRGGRDRDRDSGY